MSRVEVNTGRRWTDKQKCSLIAESFEPGQLSPKWRAKVGAGQTYRSTAGGGKSAAEMTGLHKCDRTG